MEISFVGQKCVWKEFYTTSELVTRRGVTLYLTTEGGNKQTNSLSGHQEELWSPLWPQGGSVCTVFDPRVHSGIKAPQHKYENQGLCCV